MKKGSSELKASLHSSMPEEDALYVDAEKTMTFLQYLHEIQRKIKAMNSRFFKEEEMVESQGIQNTIEEISKTISESKQGFHFLKVSQGKISWR